MARKKMREKPRSPITTEIFEAFVEKLRTEPFIDDAVCDRLHAVLVSEEEFDDSNLEAALFENEKRA